MKHPSDLDPGQIKFHQSCRPPITPGTYTVKVNQNVTQLGDFDSEPFVFSVAGPRFSLSPSDVYSVYPPNEKAGDCKHAAAVVSFAHPAVERSGSLTGGEGRYESGMALLVFSAADFPTGSKFPRRCDAPRGRTHKPRQR